jgi:hypothetical protein
MTSSRNCERYAAGVGEHRYSAVMLDTRASMIVGGLAAAAANGFKSPVVHAEQSAKFVKYGECVPLKAKLFTDALPVGILVMAIKTVPPR